MISSFVVDVSVGIAWVHPSQASPDTDRLLEAVALNVMVVVPALWFLEVSNVLLVAQRRNRLTATQRQIAMGVLSRLELTVDEEGSRYAFGRTSELAENHGLSIYDAVYLELAVRHALPIASRNEGLNQAAKKCGLTVL